MNPLNPQPLWLINKQVILDETQHSTPCRGLPVPDDSCRRPRASTPCARSDLLPHLPRRKRGYVMTGCVPFPRFLRLEPGTLGNGKAGDKSWRRPEAGLELIARLAAARAAPNARAIDTAGLPLPATLGAR